MDALADAPLAGTLTILGLLDGLSVGTLLIPVFLLLRPGRVRAPRLLLYLATIAVFYLGVGGLFMLGVGGLFMLGLVNVVDSAQAFLTSPAGLVTRLVGGVALLVIAFAIPTTGRTEPDEASHAEGTGRAPSHAVGETSDGAAPRVRTVPGRLARWREALLAERTPPLLVMGVAIAAGLVEVATMLPYIVAMTMLAEAPLDTPARAAGLAFYCLMMIAPALLLLVLRVVAARAVDRPLRRLADWLSRTGAENTAWILGIVGFIVARSAAQELGLFEPLSTLFG